jgi:glutamate-5-semialdehyde dehydrogenase
MDIQTIAKNAKTASREIASASTGKKNATLNKMAHLLRKNKEAIIKANQRDIDLARKKGLPESMLRRLVFGKAKLESRINALKRIIALPDPVGQVNRMEKRPNGILMGRMRVPLGVILMIYEARPHVTINAGAFALKSGNAVILKGGKESSGCNSTLGALWQEALDSEGLPANTINCITASHEEVSGLLARTDWIDLVIPRGGKALIKSIVEKSKIPVIKHFE